MGLLLALQLAAMAAGFAYLWRRQQRMSAEIARLQQTVEALERARAMPQRRAKRAAAGRVVVQADDAPVVAAPAPMPESPRERAARAWGMQSEPARRSPADDVWRSFLLVLLAIAPGAVMYAAGPVTGVATGMAVSAVMMLAALRPLWRPAAWASVLTAGVWALLGLTYGEAAADPVSFSACAALAGAAGLVHAQARHSAAGVAMAFAMGVATLSLGWQAGMTGPAGAAFAMLVAGAAAVGASSLRLEAIHLAAFGAALLGLFVLSGQEEAAIWFTPAAAWAGALFLAVAAVRVPQLGEGGVVVAGAGALAPIGAIAALHLARHGLADPFAAAAAFAALALALTWIIAESARRAGSLAALKLTLWVLATGAFASAASAVWLIAPAPLAAVAFALFGAGLAALDLRAPSAAWRAFACISGAFAAGFALSSGHGVLAEARAPVAAIAIGLVLPALVLGGAGFCAQRARAPALSGFFKVLALGLGVTAGDLALRHLFSGGATMLLPIGFVEACAHVALWLAAALAIGSRARGGAFILVATALFFLALAAAVVACGARAAAEWGAAPSAAWRETLALFLLSALFSAHWWFWRARGAGVRARLSLGAGALLMAAFVTVATQRAEGAPDWAAALVGALSFALATGVNFAPDVAGAGGARQSDFEEDLHRRRRGQQRRHAG